MDKIYKLLFNSVELHMDDIINCENKTRSINIFPDPTCNVIHEDSESDSVSRRISELENLIKKLQHEIVELTHTCEATKEVNQSRDYYHEILSPQSLESGNNQFDTSNYDTSDDVNFDYTSIKEQVSALKIKVCSKLEALKDIHINEDLSYCEIDGIIDCESEDKEQFDQLQKEFSCRLYPDEEIHKDHENLEIETQEEHLKHVCGVKEEQETREEFFDSQNQELHNANENKLDCTERDQLILEKPERQEKSDDFKKQEQDNYDKQEINCNINNAKIGQSKQEELVQEIKPTNPEDIDNNNMQEQDNELDDDSKQEQSNQFGEENIILGPQVTCRLVQE